MKTLFHAVYSFLKVRPAVELLDEQQYRIKDHAAVELRHEQWLNCGLNNGWPTMSHH
jgi:hypothetical protein